MLFKYDLSNIDNKIKDYEYKSFNRDYDFEDSRLYEIRKPTYNADEKSEQLTQISEENKKYIDEVVPKNKNYQESIKKYRQRIIAGLYIQAINQIIKEKYGYNSKILNTIAKEIHFEKNIRETWKITRENGKIAREKKKNII